MTLAACKRLKAKRDKAKEIAELDVGNIIESSRIRSTRSTRLSSASCIQSPAPARKINRYKLNEDDEEETSENDEEKDTNTDFSKIKDLIDSDESDSSEKKAKIKSKSNKNAVLDSE